MFTPITNLYEKFIVSQLLSYKPNSVKFKQHHEQKQEGNEIRYKDVMAVDKTCNFYILEQDKLGLSCAKLSSSWFQAYSATN